MAAATTWLIDAVMDCRSAARRPIGVGMGRRSATRRPIDEAMECRSASRWPIPAVVENGSATRSDGDQLRQDPSKPPLIGFSSASVRSHRRRSASAPPGSVATAVCPCRIGPKPFRPPFAARRSARIRNGRRLPSSDSKWSIPPLVSVMTVDGLLGHRRKPGLELGGITATAARRVRGYRHRQPVGFPRM